MPEENENEGAGHHIDVNLPGVGLGAAAGVAPGVVSISGPVTNLSITVNVAGGAAAAEAPAQPLLAGVFIRQALSATQVAYTWIPGDHPEQPDRTVEARPAPGAIDRDTLNWLEWLGNPPGLNLDDGVAMLQLLAGSKSGAAIWLPNNAAGQVIVNFLKGSAQGAPPPGSDYDDFVACVQASGGSAKAIARCLVLI